MADREKIKQGIKACWSEYFYHKCCDCPYASDDKTCVERLGADALELLKEQEAVEPITDSARNRRCPKCNTILKGKFCLECGQAVKWNEVD